MPGKRILILSVAFFAFSLASAVSAQAATGPQFLITWQASNSYAPAGYTGKILPTIESQIAAALTIISGGQPLNLSNQTIYWYLNGNFLGGGVGVTHTSFQPYGTPPTALTLKVELPNYPSGILTHEIVIPMVQPQAVIVAPYPSGNFATTQPTVQAVPYFFNATSTMALGINWSVNGQTVSSAENPQTLNISLPQGTASGFVLAVSLTMRNPNDSTIAGDTTNLTYQKQL